MLTIKLSSLGLFKFAEKKATQSRIEEIEKELAELRKKVSDLKSDLQKEIQKLKDSLTSRKEQLSGEIEKKYPLGESPIQKKARLEIIRDWFGSISKEEEGHHDHVLGEVVAYAILTVMQDASDEKGISFSWGDTDWESRNFNPKDAEPVFRKVLPNLLTMFGLESADITNMRGLNEQILHALLRNYLPERGLVDTYVAEDRKRYFVMK